MYELLGIPKTVGELVELLRENVIDEDAVITAAGATCYVISNYDKDDKIINIIFDDDDYSEEWNEQFI